MQCYTLLSMIMVCMRSWMSPFVHRNPQIHEHMCHEIYEGGPSFFTQLFKILIHNTIIHASFHKHFHAWSFYSASLAESCLVYEMLCNNRYIKRWKWRDDWYREDKVLIMTLMRWWKWSEYTCCFPWTYGRKILLDILVNGHTHFIIILVA